MPAIVRFFALRFCSQRLHNDAMSLMLRESAVVEMISDVEVQYWIGGWLFWCLSLIEHPRICERMGSQYVGLGGRCCEKRAFFVPPCHLPRCPLSACLFGRHAFEGFHVVHSFSVGHCRRLIGFFVVAHSRMLVDECENISHVRADISLLLSTLHVSWIAVHWQNCRQGDPVRA